MKINEVLNQLNGYDAKENEELKTIASMLLELTKMYEEKKYI